MTSQPDPKRAGAVDLTDKDMFFDWLFEVARLPYPEDDADQVAVLGEAKVKPGVKWHEMVRCLILMAAEYGSYGTEIRPSRQTLGVDYGVSSRTVGRWLDAAVSLGLLTLVKHATPRLPAVYEIAPFWEVTKPDPNDPWAGTTAPIQ